MNTRLATFLATLTLLVPAGGCSGMKNFLFGRGAACTTCASATPTYGIAPPREPACGYEPTCGYEPVCGREPACGYEPAYTDPLLGSHRGCGLLQGRSTCNAGPGCACNSAARSYMPSEVGSYYGEVHDPYAHNGEVIGSQVIGDTYNGYPVQSYPTPGSVIEGGMVPGSSYPGVTTQDNFDARGDRIIQVDPIPSR